MLLEFAILGASLKDQAAVADCAASWVEGPHSAGRLLGLWRSEVGALGRVLVLRAFDEPHDMTVERRRALMSENPFGCGAMLTGLDLSSYSAFPFLPAIRTGERGPVYEFRTYVLRAGALPGTMAAWEDAIEPARPYTDHLVTNMHALDGPPRITHIWAFPSLEERARLRGAAFTAGAWPPKGGPDKIAEPTSILALPHAASPLR